MSAMPAASSPPISPPSLLAALAGNAIDDGYAAAAARRGGGARPTSVSAAAVLAVLAVIGLLLATSATQTRREAPALSAQEATLRAEIARAERRAAGLEAARTALDNQVRSAAVAATRLRTETARAQGSLRVLEASTGAAAVTGPGLRIRLDDAGTRSDDRIRRVTDRDVQRVVNALWAAGAEAIAVDGFRLTARSAIRSAGDAVLVNYRPLVPPYVITAVGARRTLAARFAASPAAAALRTAAAVDGLGFTFATADRLTVAAAPLPPPRSTPAATP